LRVCKGYLLLTFAPQQVFVPERTFYLELNNWRGHTLNIEKQQQFSQHTNKFNGRKNVQNEENMSEISRKWHVKIVISIELICVTIQSKLSFLQHNEIKVKYSKNKTIIDLFGWKQSNSMLFKKGCRIIHY
jgi:hypothetical protein